MLCALLHQDPCKARSVPTQRGSTIRLRDSCARCNRRPASNIVASASPMTTNRRLGALATTCVSIESGQSAIKEHIFIKFAVFCVHNRKDVRRTVAADVGHTAPADFQNVPPFAVSRAFPPPIPTDTFSPFSCTIFCSLSTSSRLDSPVKNSNTASMLLPENSFPPSTFGYSRLY